MARLTPATAAVLFLAVTAGTHAAWTSTSLSSACGPTNSAGAEVPSGKYSQASAAELLDALLGDQIVYFGSRTASLVGTASQAGLIEFCQGPFFDQFAAPGTQPGYDVPNAKAAVFTTGNGSIAAHVPKLGQNVQGLDSSNVAANNRYGIQIGSPGAVDVGSPDRLICEVDDPAGGDGGDDSLLIRSFDASGLQASMIPSVSGALSLKYTFASEEYPEYTNPSVPYKDQFRLFMKVTAPDGTIVSDWQNYATLPDGSTVGIDSINNVNPEDNPDLYIDNIYYRNTGYSEYPTQYDGFTVLLESKPITFRANDKIDVFFVVTDCGDLQLDSAVLLQANSVFIDTAPQCVDITVAPLQSLPGETVSVSVSYNELENPETLSIACTFGASPAFMCPSPTVSGTTVSCGFTFTPMEGDYGNAVVCTATEISGNTVTCESELLVLGVFPTPPVCAGITATPNPAPMGSLVTVTTSFTETEPTSITCTFGVTGDASQQTCTEFDIAGDVASCTFSITAGGGSYGTVVCSAVDVEGWTSGEQSCFLMLEQLLSILPLPSPASVDPLPSPTGVVPPMPPSPATSDPLPSPRGVVPPMPSPMGSDPMPSPTVMPSSPSLPQESSPSLPPQSPSLSAPSPSGDLPQEVSPSLPAPPVVPPSPPSPKQCMYPEPMATAALPEGASAYNSNCSTYSGVNKINGPVDVPCSKCQWECLTHRGCSAISMYTDTTVTRESLYTYNCGDGAWKRGANLCILMGGEPTIALDTQDQICSSCVEQCLTWGECTGVYMNYVYTAKEDLDLGCCT